MSRSIFSGPTWRSFGALGMLLALGAQAQPPPLPAIAVYSQLAREVSVVQFQESIGTRINNNVRQRIPVPDGALDKVVVVLAGQALRQAMPTVNPWLVAPTDEDLFDALQNASEGSKVAIADDMMAALKERGSTQLLLFTRFRAEATLRTTDSREGTGQLEGLGFYVDTSTRMKRGDTNEVGIGFLAPYAHFRSTLVDVATQRVLRTQTTTEGYVLSSARAQGSTHAWDVMTPSQKMSTLRDMLTTEIRRVVPELMAKR